MKKSEFIKKVLKSKSNTVFVNEDQVENAIEVFLKIGMVPPVNKGKVELQELDNGDYYIPIWGWEEE